MTPTSFTVKNGITTFHYKVSELFNFVRSGFKDGNVGMIIIHKKDNILTYKGFGTIEHPCKHIITLTVKHNELFDGKMLTDEERLIPPKPFITKQNSRFVIIDLSNNA